MNALLAICASLSIYSTVCVEWIAQPDITYTMYFSKDLVEWEVVPAYNGYTTDKTETNRMWRAEGEAGGFFVLETNGVLIVEI